VERKAEKLRLSPLWCFRLKFFRNSWLHWISFVQTETDHRAGRPNAPDTALLDSCINGTF
jgi:hypothetical protein